MVGKFYASFPHNLLASIFGAVFVIAMVAPGIGVKRFPAGCVLRHSIRFRYRRDDPKRVAAYLS